MPLLALKAKGYRPRVIVTDLRKERLRIDEIFSDARHHECIFHAMQWLHRQLKKVYGANTLKPIQKWSNRREDGRDVSGQDPPYRQNATWL